MKATNRRRKTLLSLLLALALVVQIPLYASAEPGQQGDAGSTLSGTLATSAEGGASDADTSEGASDQGSSNSGASNETEPDLPEAPPDGTETEKDETGASDDEGEDGTEETDASAADEDTAAEDDEDSALELLAATDLNGALVTISSAVSANKYVDISGSSDKPLAPAVIWTQGRTPNQRFKLAKDSAGYYTITSVSSNLVLDVTGSGTKNGTKIVQYSATGGNNQKWKIIQNTDGSYSFVSKLNSSVYLDLADTKAANGSALIVYGKDSKRASQRFAITPITPAVSNGVYTIQSVASGKLLDMWNASFDNSAPAIANAANKQLSQRFILSYNTQNGYYTIKSVNSNRVLDVERSSSNDGASVIQYSASNGYNQRWSIEKASNGSYYFYAAHSGKRLDLKGGSAADSTPVIVWSPHNGSNQQWRLAQSALVDAALSNVRSRTGWFLDIRGTSEANNADALLFSATGGLNQKFFPKKIGAFSSNIYVLECAHSGKLLSAGSSTGNKVYQYADQGKGSGNTYQQWIIEPIGSARFRFKNVATGKYLDYSKDASGTVLQLNEKSDTSRQAWTFPATASLSDGLYAFASALNNNLVFDIPGSSTKAGESLTVWPAHNGPNQMFRVTSMGSNRYSIINLNSGLALDIEGSALDSKTGAGKVVQWAYHGGVNQTWVIEYVGSGNFRIVSMLQNKRASMTVGSANPANGTAVNLLDTNGAATQMFKPTFAGSVSYYPMSYTLDKFVSWQSGNANELKPVIDPTAANKGGYALLQFADVRVSTGVTGAQLNAYIDSTALGRSGIFHNRGQAFVNAANKYKINEVYFLSHAILESAWGTSNFAKGNYYDGKRLIGGKTYPAGTYYNFWGIGAYDSNPNYAIDYAVIHGWNSPEKAIDGSADWIATYYIYGTGTLTNGKAYPQPTVYAMRWDYARANATGTRGWHQYATSLTWQNSIPLLMNNCYVYSGVSPKLYYIIPRFK